MIRQIEVDHFPDVVTDNAGFRRLEIIGIADTLYNPKDRRDFFKNFSDENYRKALGYINSLVRGRGIDFSYQNRADSKYRPERLETPNIEDIPELMSNTFQTVRGILTDSRFHDGPALMTAGLTLSGAVNLIHPYENGNGRTARVIHYLMEFGTERGKTALEEELYAIIGKLPLYERDQKLALNDMSNSIMITLNRALSDAVLENYSEAETFGEEEVAKLKVDIFLKMMREEIKVKAKIGFGIYPITVNARDTMFTEYLSSSSIPYRQLDKKNKRKSRILGERTIVIPGSK